MSDRAWVLKYQHECNKVQGLQTHCGQTWISLGQIIIQRYFVFVSTAELRTLFIQELSYMNTFCECILKKVGLTRTYAHFQYNSRKLVNVVKVRFSMMYSSRKFINKKVITTACNFWRQIACSFQVYGCTNHFCAKSTRKTLFWISRFFYLTNIDVTSCFFRQFSDRSTKIRAKKQQFLIANISEIRASIELKLHSVFIWFAFH